MLNTFIYFLFTFFTLNLFFGSQQVYAVPYDHSYVIECVPKPEAPLYNGGITINPEFNDELKGWTASGKAKIAHAKSPDGNGYAVVSNTVQVPTDGISQTVNVERGKLYTVSGWFQLTKGEASVYAIIETSTGMTYANYVVAKAGCWTMFKGGFHVNVTESAQLSFGTNSIESDMWVDSIALQVFTQEEWDSHQAESVEKVRKAKVKFEVVNELGKAVADAALTIKQKEPHFPFGCAINHLIINHEPYQKWFLEKGFRYTAFENELKWGYNERSQGVEDYSLPDAMLEFAKKHNIAVRGHNILWDDPKYLEPWQKSLTPEQLHEAAMRRVNSVVTRYKGQFIHWDVINENMHFALFSNLTNGGTDVFKLLNKIDPLPIPFLNEYNVIEEPSLIGKAAPAVFLNKIDHLRKGGYDGPLGIGLESHFNYVQPNFPYIRAAIDILHATNFPIWVTEFDVDTLTKNWMLPYMEPLLRELHSHPYVNGIILWAALDKNLVCFRMCLTDNDYKNLPPGDVLDKFMAEFITVADTTGKTDASGAFEASLFHGVYEASVTLPKGHQHPEPQTFELLPGGEVTAVRFRTRR